MFWKANKIIMISIFFFVSIKSSLVFSNTFFQAPIFAKLYQNIQVSCNWTPQSVTCEAGKSKQCRYKLSAGSWAPSWFDIHIEMIIHYLFDVVTNAPVIVSSVSSVITVCISPGFAVRVLWSKPSLVFLLSGSRGLFRLILGLTLPFPRRLTPPKGDQVPPLLPRLAFRLRHGDGGGGGGGGGFGRSSLSQLLLLFAQHGAALLQRRRYGCLLLLAGLVERPAAPISDGALGEIRGRPRAEVLKGRGERQRPLQQSQA